MIDVWWAVSNGVWVVGLATALAALSWSSWKAERTGQRWRAVLWGASFLRLGLDIGLVLFYAGLALAARSWAESGLWSVLTVVWGILALKVRGRSHSSSLRSEDDGDGCQPES